MRVGKILSFLWIAASCHAQLREWTSADGRKISGLLLGTERETVTLRIANGASSVVALDKLSAQDRDFVTDWAKSRSSELALPPVSWPSEIATSQAKLDGPSNGKDGWTITTQHYEINSQEQLATAAVLDLATIGEATYKWLHAWPLPMPKQDPTLLNRIRIFKNRTNFEAAGSDKETAGIFKGGEQGELQLPFESLGIESSPDTPEFRKGTGFTPKVLIHEMAHQQMSECLFLLPMWLQEGLAEYAALPAYRAGRFVTTKEALLTRLKQHLEDYETRDPLSGARTAGGQRIPMESWMVPLKQLLNPMLSNASWDTGTLADKHRLYLTSLLTSFYLLQLDGDGQARRFRVYWNEMLKAREYHISHGQSGSIPEGVERNRHSITRALMAKYLSQQTPEAMQADMIKRFSAAGIRVSFPAGN